MTEIKYMTEQELLNEINGIQQMIDLSSYGTKDLLIQEQYMSELENRGYEIIKQTVYTTDPDIDD